MWKWSLKNIKNYFEDTDSVLPVKGNIEVDYFMHCWDTNTWRLPHKPRNFCPQDTKHSDYEEIVNAYNMKSAVLEEYSNDKFIQAWDPLFYSFAKSVALKRQYELDNDFEYDLVIKARLDTVYNPASKFPYATEFVGQRTVYAPYNILPFPNEFNYWNFDDVIFYGHSNTMDIVADIYKSNKTLYNDEYVNEYTARSDRALSYNFYGPGCTLYEYIVNAGLRADYPRHHPIQYKVSRMTMKHLDALTDWSNVVKLANYWYVMK
jgi:hypothetical protein